MTGTISSSEYYTESEFASKPLSAVAASRNMPQSRTQESKTETMTE